MESRVKRLGFNTLLVFLGKASSSLIGLLMLPFYTHWLSPTDYGTSDLVFTYSSILVSFISCCMADAVFIYCKGSCKDDKSAFFTSGIEFLLVSFFIFGFIILGIYYIGIYSGINSTFFEQSWYIFAIAVGSALQMYMQSFVQSIDKMKQFTLTGVFFTSIIAFMSFLLLPTYGLKGYLWAYIIANFCSFGFSLLISKAYKYFRISYFDREKCKLLLSYGIPIIPNGIMWWLVSGINRPIMESTLGIASVGIFAVANKIPSVISMLSGIFSTAWSITMLEEFGKKDFDIFFNKIVQFNFFVLTIAGMGIAIFSKEIVNLFASVEFIDAWRYIPFLVYSVILQNLSALIGGIFSAQKRSKYFFYTSVWGAITSLICTYYFVSYLGLYGVCLAMILSFVAMVITRLRYAWDKISSINIVYYIVMSALYLGLSFVVISSFSPYIKLMVYISIFTTIFVLNKLYLRSFYRLSKTIFKRINKIS